MSTVISHRRRCVVLLAIGASIGGCGGPGSRTDSGAVDAGTMDGMDATAPLLDGGPGDAGCALSSFYADTDGDGFGDPEVAQEACTQPAGHVANADDCDDSRADASPDATEVCNGLDDDCDGGSDDDFPCVRGATVDCTTGCGSIGTGTCTDDCMLPDADACTPPAEICNTIDDDCDGLDNEGVLILEPTQRAAFAQAFLAPVAVADTTDDDILATFWLSGGSVYGFGMRNDGPPYAGETPSLIAARTRFHASSGSYYPVVAYVDAAGTNQGEIVVTWRDPPTSNFTERANRRITTLLGAQLYTDVRVLGMDTGLTLVVGRHRDGFIREVLYDTAFNVLDNNLLLVTTTGPFAVDGDIYRYVIATTQIDAAGNAIALYGSGTMAAVTRTISLGTAVPRDVAIAVDSTASPPDALVVWSEVAAGGASGAIRYAWFPGLTDAPTIGSISARTTPVPPSDARYLSVDFAHGLYYVIAMEAGMPSATMTAPAAYELQMEPAPAIHLLGTLAADAYRGVSVFARPYSGIGYAGFVYHNTAGAPGFGFNRIACPPPP